MSDGQDLDPEDFDLDRSAGPDLADVGVRDLLADDGPIARRLEGFETRDEQTELAVAIESALRDGEHLVAEAGTGVGKSFAYLLPAILHALRHPDHGPVVVSTRTIGLQEQLAERDLPFLQSVLPLEWTAVTAVGRNHYVCLRRLVRAQREGGDLFSDNHRAAELTRVAEWANQSWDGLRFELDPPVEDAVWDEVQAEHGNCLHKACKHYDVCGYQRARRRLETAQVIVVNHALYVADLSLRMAGAQYLPAHRTVIFDEAHHLERVATEGLGLRATLGTVLWHLRRLKPSGRKRPLSEHLETAQVRGLFELVAAEAEIFFGRLSRRVEGGRRGPRGIPEDESLDQDLLDPIGALSRECLHAASTTTEVDKKMELTARARGLESLCSVLSALCAPTGGPDGEPATQVRWIEPERKGVSLRSAPLDIGAALTQYGFSHPRTAILTSATLGPPSGGFSWLRERLGLKERVRDLQVGSPFDYSSQVRFGVAEALPDPVRQPDAFRRGCIDELREQLLENGGRALVLCTSWRSVREFSEALRADLADIDVPLLVHGEAPLRELLRRKREEPNSVLIGTDTFWEGVDVPGNALTLVVIERLPFAQPDHPLTKARVAVIEARGGDAFAELSLPEALLKFRQGFGRLIRRTDDRGTVLVLDPRIRTRGYGAEFLRALPDGANDD